MKKILLSLTLVSLSVYVVFAEDIREFASSDTLGITSTVPTGVPAEQMDAVSVLWDSANSAFLNEQYPLSVVNYEALLSRGMESSALYYNLGNAYFQQNQLGKAILNYTRANILSVWDEDISYNLELAQSRTKDKIDSVPQFFLVRWFSSLSYLFSSNQWAILVLLFLFIGFSGIIFWLISSRFRMRKLGFIVGVFSLCLSLVSLLYSSHSSVRQFGSIQAVIINNASPIKSSPSAGGKDLFMLHEGTIVIVEEVLGDWSEIRIVDGNKGWVLSSAIEVV